MARRIVQTLCGVVLLSVLATSSTGAFDNGSRTAHFTFSGPVRLPGVTLPAGTYTFVRRDLFILFWVWDSTEVRCPS